MTRRALKALILAVFAAVPVVACGGKTISIGNNSADLQKVDPTKLSSEIGSCPAGYQHPNICCEGGTNTASTCGAYLDAPFRPCDSGWTTYPNASECCSVDDPTKCVAPSTSGIGGGGSACNWMCPPGWWPEAATKGDIPPCDPLSNGGQCGSGSSGNTGSCCQLLSSGGTICQNWLVATPLTDNCATASPPPDLDASVLDGGSFGDGAVPPDAGSGGIDAGTFNCDDAGVGTFDAGVQNCACPDGFTATTAEADVCCRNAPDGSSVCFSVANGGPSPSGGTGNGSVTPPSMGSGGGNPTPATRSCGGTAATGTTGATCSCEGATNSQKQAMDCAGTPVTCTCSVDGVVTTSFLSAAADCSSADWAKCGF